MGVNTWDNIKIPGKTRRIPENHGAGSKWYSGVFGWILEDDESLDTYKYWGIHRVLTGLQASSLKRAWWRMVKPADAHCVLFLK